MAAEGELASSAWELLLVGILALAVWGWPGREWSRRMVVECSRFMWRIKPSAVVDLPLHAG